MPPCISSPVLDRLLSLVSPRAGIVRDLQEYERAPMEPKPPYIYQATLSNFDFRIVPLSDRATAGKGETRDEAIIGALGEAIERYCASHFDPKSSLVASLSECQANSVSPLDVGLYSDRQYATPNFPYRPYDADAPTRWVHGITLPDRKAALAPASMTYLNADSQRDGECFCLATSSGLAAGPDLDSAVLAGICELVERDAFLATWMNRLPAPRVERPTCELVESVAAQYARFGRELHIFNITTDNRIPAMLALLVNRTGFGLAAAVGLGCHPKPTVALKKAVLEVCQVHASESARMALGPITDAARGYDQVQTLWDHSGYFSLPERLFEFDFLLHSGRSQNLSTIPSAPDELHACVDVLSRAGARILYVELTTPDIADLGFHVVRVFVAGLQPIHFGFGQERLGGRRLFEVARAMGYDANERTQADFNPCPHPFG